MTFITKVLGLSPKFNQSIGPFAAYKKRPFFNLEWLSI